MGLTFAGRARPFATVVRHLSARAAALPSSHHYVAGSSLPTYLPAALLKPSPPLPSLLSRPFLRQTTSTFSTGSSNIVVVGSDAELNSALKIANDGQVPAMFYFTAKWCGPCRFISPVIEELSKKYTHVTIYKIDIDMDGLGRTLALLNISAVPTLHFFHNGKKMSEVVGADVSKLKETMSDLYMF